MENLKMLKKESIQIIENGLSANQLSDIELMTIIGGLSDSNDSFAPNCSENFLLCINDSHGDSCIDFCVDFVVW